MVHRPSFLQQNKLNKYLILFKERNSIENIVQIDTKYHEKWKCSHKHTNTVFENNTERTAY